MGQSRTLPPRMQNMYQRSNSWNGAQQWQRPSSSSSSSSGMPVVAGERPQHHTQHHHYRGERSERGERVDRGLAAPAVHVLPPRMRAVKAPRHQTANTAIDASFGLVAPPSPPSPSDPLGLGRNLDQLNAARPSVSRSYNNDMSNIPAQNVLYTTGGPGMMMVDHTRTSQLSPEAPVFQPRFGMPASAPLYHSSVDEFPFPSYNGGGGSGGGGYQSGDHMVGNIGDSMDLSSAPSSALGVSFSSPSTSPTRTSPTAGSPPKFTKLPPIAPPPMTKPDDNTPPPPAYLVNFLASKFGPASPSSTSAPAVPMPMATTTALPTPVVANIPAFVAAPVQLPTPVVDEPSMVLYDSALSSSVAPVIKASITIAVPPPTAKMIPSSSSTMSLVPTVPILKLPTPPNKRSAPSTPPPRPAPSPPRTPTKAESTPSYRRPSPPSRSSYIVADMLLNRIRSSPLRPGLGPRRATSPAAVAASGGSTSPVSRSCLSKEVMMEDVVMMSLPVSS